MLALGTLAGLGFNLDFGSGPPLVAALFALVVWRTRSLRSTMLFSTAVFPWLAAGIGINYAIGGVWKPINMYPEHFQFPGSPFTEENLTGFLRHEPLDQFLYAGGMLFGKKGFLNHNLPLLLLLSSGWFLFRTPIRFRAELLTMLGWVRGDLAVVCHTVEQHGRRLLLGAPVISFLCRGSGGWQSCFAIDRNDAANFCASRRGLVLAGLMWWKGPWTQRMAPMLWPIVGCALLTTAGSDGA